MNTPKERQMAVVALACIGFAAMCSGCGGTLSADDSTSEQRSGETEDRPSDFGAKADLYGEDDRREYADLDDETLRRVARATPALVDESKVSEAGDSSVRLAADTLAEERGLCPSVRFSDQPAPVDCSGFLVAPDILVTAGHCIESADICESTRAVFGFRYGDDQSEIDTVPEGDVYECESILSREWQPQRTYDYAVIRLDRPVEEVEPLRFRTDGTVPEETSLAIAGYPMGVPLKITPGGSIVENSEELWFRYDLDAFGGNSGSPVVDAETGLVEGIHVRGATDFETSTENGESCDVPHRCDEVDTDNFDCSGTIGTRAPVFAAHVPGEESSADTAESCCRVCVDGAACGDECISPSASCGASSGCACDAPAVQPPGSNSSADPATCAGVLGCLDGCEDDETECRRRCLREASPEAWKRLRSLASCQKLYCFSSEDPDSCTESICPSKYEACAS